MTDFTIDALIAENNMLAFGPEVVEQDRQDIADMLMYADFFASQSYPMQDSWMGWLEYYRSQLIKAGCKLTSPLVKEPMFITDARELDTIGFGLKGAVRAANLIALAHRSLKAARLNDYASHFFQYATESGSLGRFQVLPCEAIAGTDIVRILLLGVHVSATLNSGWVGGDWRKSREMVVRLGGGLYEFNRSAYAAHRARIRARLSEVSNFNIRRVSI
ncbi:hypothetical protein ACCD10_21670 [Pseudomonas sp. Pseusp122]|uniref:hypothetical protein n=1 Tax=unclassified Pseudomonas TaxID=196821 RepID=UPI0039A6D38B